MEKFCNFITNPDWWGVGATIIAAFVAAVITYVLGKRQNELQEQQLKIQERQNELQEQQLKLQEQQIKLQEQQNAIQGYEMHKMMYQFVMETNAYAHGVIPQICHYLQEYNPYEDIAPLIKMKEDVDAMSKDFNDKFVDINIQLSFLEAFDYDNLLYDMKRVVEKLEEIINEGGIKSDYKVEELIITTDDSVYINGILGYIKDEFIDEYRVVLEEFVENKDYITECLNSYIEGKVKNISF